LDFPRWISLGGFPKDDSMARILLAEDDAALRRFLQRGLERAGHRVEEAEDGDAAQAALERRPFDLLIADIVMPGMDGIELARRACLERPDLRVMFITGFAAIAVRAQAFHAPAGVRILSKPFHLRELVAEVDRMLHPRASAS
jgi:two-component system, cell cycle response regulator CpdR